MHPVQKYNNKQTVGQRQSFGINLNIFVAIGTAKLCPYPDRLLIAPQKPNTHTQVR